MSSTWKKIVTSEGLVCEVKFSDKPLVSEDISTEYVKEDQIEKSKRNLKTQVEEKGLEKVAKQCGISVHTLKVLLSS